MPRLTTQEDHETFEELAGGPVRAFTLLRIWESTSEPSKYDALFNQAPSRTDKFRKLAHNNGYSDEAVQAFLNLQ